MNFATTEQSDTCNFIFMAVATKTKIKIIKINEFVTKSVCYNK